MKKRNHSASSSKRHGGKGLYVLPVITSLLLTPSLAAADCYTWPLREGKGGRLAYDGDTVYITMPGVPAELSDMSVRVNGVDTPEIRGKCAEEKAQAKAARSFVIEKLTAAQEVQFCNPEWGKYAGRVLADVVIDGVNLADLLIQNGMARAYDGGSREGWCD